MYSRILSQVNNSIFIAKDKFLDATEKNLTQLERLVRGTDKLSLPDKIKAAIAEVKNEVQSLQVQLSTQRETLNLTAEEARKINKNISDARAKLSKFIPQIKTAAKLQMENNLEITKSIPEVLVEINKKKDGEGDSVDYGTSKAIANFQEEAAKISETHRVLTKELNETKGQDTAISEQLATLSSRQNQIAENLAVLKTFRESLSAFKGVTEYSNESKRIYDTLAQQTQTITNLTDNESKQRHLSLDEIKMTAETKPETKDGTLQKKAENMMNLLYGQSKMLNKTLKLSKEIELSILKIENKTKDYKALTSDAQIGSFVGNGYSSLSHLLTGIEIFIKKDIEKVLSSGYLNGTESQIDQSHIRKRDAEINKLIAAAEKEILFVDKIIQKNNATNPIVNEVKQQSIPSQNIQTKTPSATDDNPKPIPSQMNEEVDEEYSFNIHAEPEAKNIENYDDIVAPTFSAEPGDTISMSSEESNTPADEKANLEVDADINLDSLDNLLDKNPITLIPGPNSDPLEIITLNANTLGQDNELESQDEEQYRPPGLTMRS